MYTLAVSFICSRNFFLDEWLIPYPFSDRLLRYSFSLAGANGGM